MTGALALPVLPVVMPLIGAALLAGGRRWLPRAGVDLIAITAAAANLCVCIALLHHALYQTVVYWAGGWRPRGSLVIGIGLVIDPAAAGCASLASLLAFFALLYSWRRIDSGEHHYQPLMLILLASMCGLALTGDLFNMFVFVELMSTAAFALCGLETREPAPLQGAFNFAVTNTIAAFMILMGLGILSAITGALNMAQMGHALGSRHDAITLFAAVMITCGFLIKTAIVPFHFWLPDAHAVAPTPVCVLFSGIMVELGLYALLRINGVVFGASFAAHHGLLRDTLMVLGVVSVALGGVMAYAEHHLKRMLAFSTISHVGLLLTLLAIGTPYAIAALLLYLLAHALIKSSLFFCSGILLHRFRTVSEPHLFGQGRCLRWTALVWLLGSLGLAIAPPLAVLFSGVWGPGTTGLDTVRWLPWLFVGCGVLTGGATLRAGVHIFFGWGDAAIADRISSIETRPETAEDDHKIPWYHFAPAALLLAGVAGVLFVPATAAYALLAGTRLADGLAYIQTTYTGITAPLIIEPLQRSGWGASWLPTFVALIAGMLLAASSVFRLRLPRLSRVGAFLEGPLRPLRMLQSGHPGDYVMWLTVGIAAVGLAYMLLLR